MEEATTASADRAAAPFSTPSAPSPGFHRFRLSQHAHSSYVGSYESGLSDGADGGHPVNGDARLSGTTSGSSVIGGRQDILQPQLD
jgi:hypothetical protein